MSDFQHTVNAVAICVQTQQACLLTGMPGDGKTRIVEAILQETCAEHETSIVALHEPPEYGGYPMPTDEGVALLPTRWARRLAKVDEGKLAGLFLDELSNGAPATRSAAMRGILDGTWGEQHIPRLTTVAAMNPPDVAESGYDLSAPLANRFCHIDWDMPVEYWVEALVADFPTPRILKLSEKWREQNIVWAKTLLASFAHVRPAVIKQLPKEASARSGPWPSIRSWTMAMELLAGCRSVGFDLEHDTTVMLIAGCVGPAAAHEFLTYSKELDLPDPEDVLKDPKALKLPERGDRAFAVLTAVVSAVLAKNTNDRWARGWAVLARAVDQNRADVAAGSAKALARNRPKDSKGQAPKEISAFIPLLKAAGLM